MKNQPPSGGGARRMAIQVRHACAASAGSEREYREASRPAGGDFRLPYLMCSAAGG